MRYYAIIISDPNTGEVLVPNKNRKPGFTKVAAGPGVATYTTLKNGMTPSMIGSTLPGAQNVEFDIPVSVMDTPAGSAYISIWGVSLQEIAQASNLNNLSIKVYGGMAKGLPLANPAQSGLLIEGSIQQAYGNWQDVNMTLNLVVNASYGTAAAPSNIVFNWLKGQQLSAAIDNTLATAFPQYKRNINISPNLVITDNQEPAYCSTVVEFAQYIKQLSQKIIGGDYAGVDILLTQNTFSVYDGSSPKTPKELKFVEMIGQPVWIGPSQIHVECVMRADLNVGDYVKMPETPLITTSSASLSQYSNPRQGSIFKGIFMITNLRHVGNYRQPPGTSWISTFDMTQVTNNG